MPDRIFAIGHLTNTPTLPQGRGWQKGKLICRRLDWMFKVFVLEKSIFSFMYFCSDNNADIMDFLSIMQDQGFLDGALLNTDPNANVPKIHNMDKYHDRLHRWFDKYDTPLHIDNLAHVDEDQLINRTKEIFLPTEFYSQEFKQFLFGFAHLIKKGLPLLPLLKIFEHTHPKAENFISYHDLWYKARVVQMA
jgi:hypothetical protein